MLGKMSWSVGEITIVWHREYKTSIYQQVIKNPTIKKRDGIKS